MFIGDVRPRCRQQQQSCKPQHSRTLTTLTRGAVAGTAAQAMRRQSLSTSSPPACCMAWRHRYHGHCGASRHTYFTPSPLGCTLLLLLTAGWKLLLAGLAWMGQPLAISRTACQ